MSTVAPCDTPPAGGGDDAAGDDRARGVPWRRSVGGEVGRVRVGVDAPVAAAQRRGRVADRRRGTAAFVVGRAEPYPTRSATDATVEQLPGDLRHRRAASRRATTATLPPETARFVVPVASGVGSGAPTAAADASWTR